MGSRVITFIFRPQISRRRQDELLSEIAGWEKIDQAAHLKPETKLRALERLCYVSVADDADPDRIIHQLAQLPEIESASTPTPRHLV